MKFVQDEENELPLSYNQLYLTLLSEENHMFAVERGQKRSSFVRASPP
jgi:hypothetical protein